MGADGKHAGDAAPLGRRGVPRRRTLRYAVLALAGSALLLGAVELIVVLAGPLAPAWVSLMIPLVAGLYVGAGVLAWLRRSSSDVGALLTIGGVIWLATGFGNATLPALIATGAVTATLPLALIVHLLVGFPSGRLTARGDRALVVAGYFTALILQAPLYLFANFPPPYDALQVADRPGLEHAGLWAQRGVGIAVMTCTAVLLAFRLRAGTAAQRRVLVPLYIYGIAVVLFEPLAAIAFAPTFGWSIITTYVIQLVVAGLIPVAFGWSIMRGGFARTAEVEELGAWLGVEEHSRPTLERALADTLGDPSLRLAFWVPDRAEYVDADGRTLATAVAGGGRGMSQVDLAGERVGAIIYDVDAIGDRELVRTAGRVVATALDRERLTAQLRANHEALLRSRQRIVEAADRERRRVERNLHDGAQQQMLAVVMSLHMIETRMDGTQPTTKAMVTAAASDLESAIRELRELARGLHPTLLNEVGLSGALESLAERSPIPVRLAVGLNDGISEPTGVAAYYVVAEALTNAARYSSADRIDVRASQVDGRLRIEVTDDGIGGASPAPGSGLEGLVDRVDSLGGRIWITSSAGAGTTVLAELPCA
jgi:signal transduction histidine kinase